MVDPIYAAIAARQQAWEAHEATCKALGEYEEGHRQPDGGLPKDEMALALDDKNGEACDAAHEALLALLSTRPTTLAGVKALVEHVQVTEPRDRFLKECEGTPELFLDTLAKALTALP